MNGCCGWWQWVLYFARIINSNKQTTIQSSFKYSLDTIFIDEIRCAQEQQPFAVNKMKTNS